MNLIDFLSRILVSLVLGTMIGLERQVTGHPAGIKANMLICLGTCMFLLFPVILQSNDIQRVASCIVSGVGFLCSAVIFKEHGTVKGLNTAATLWCSAAVGVLASSGMYAFAVTATTVLVVANIIFRPISEHVNTLDQFIDEEKSCKLTIICNRKAFTEIKTKMLEDIDSNKFTLMELKTNNIDNRKVEIIALYQFVNEKNSNFIKELLSQYEINSDIKKIDWQIL